MSRTFVLHIIPESLNSAGEWATLLTPGEEPTCATAPTALPGNQPEGVPMKMFALAERAPALCTKPRTTAARVVDIRDEALGTLAISIVHDLRNPLAAIYSGAEMLNTTHLSPEQVRRLARNMFTASVRIKELLEDYCERCRK